MLFRSNLAWRAGNNRFGANLTLRYQSQSRDFQFTPAGALRAAMAERLLANIAADYRLNETWSVYGRIENVFGTPYEESFSFPAPGRAAYLGVRAAWP